MKTSLIYRVTGSAAHFSRAATPAERQRIIDARTGVEKFVPVPSPRFHPRHVEKGGYLNFAKPGAPITDFTRKVPDRVFVGGYGYDLPPRCASVAGVRWLDEGAATALDILDEKIAEKRREIVALQRQQQDVMEEAWPAAEKLSVALVKDWTATAKAADAARRASED